MIQMFLIGLSPFAARLFRFRGATSVPGQLQEDFFQAHRRGAKLIQIPSGFDHGARQVAANEASFVAFDFEDGALVGLRFVQ